jgi:hypothetical protein
VDRQVAGVDDDVCRCADVLEHVALGGDRVDEGRPRHRVGPAGLLESLHEDAIVRIEEQDRGGDAVAVQVDEGEIQALGVHARSGVDHHGDLRP